MKVILSIFFIFTFSSEIQGQDVYRSLSHNNESDIDYMLNYFGSLDNSSIKNAYTGALLAKKSSFVKELKNKIEIFNNGVQMLEHEIISYPNNIEYRFLRLTIQENSPKILKYKKDLVNDSKFIIENLSKADMELKKIITDYAKESVYLRELNE